MRKKPYDLIGDIHGHHRKLVSLLETLGYQPRNEDGFSGWRHPEGRRVIFLGDYIDRGPSSPDVLSTVKGMVDAGDALALMGNHEYNAICWHTPNGEGGWLRERRPDRDGSFEGTNQQFLGREKEWTEWREWMRQLPLFLEVDGLRAVHACWDSKRIEYLRGKSLADDGFLRASSEKGSRDYRAVENVLKGPELPLPNGRSYLDKDGIPRRAVRARWWDLPDGDAAIGPITMPEPIEREDQAVAHEIRRIPNYSPDDPPVFFGHYWRPADSAKEPYAPNLACLDYGAGHGEHPVVAYRWDGECVLRADKFVVPTAGSNCR